VIAGSGHCVVHEDVPSLPNVNGTFLLACVARFPLDGFALVGHRGLNRMREDNERQVYYVPDWGTREDSLPVFQL